MHRYGRIGCALLACLGLAMFSGCAGSKLASARTFRWPWDGPPPDEIAGITPPAKRIEQLKELGRNASRGDAQEKQRISAQLAEQVKVETDPLVRIEAMSALAACGTPTAFAALQSGLNDSDPDVRIACCRFVGRLNDPAAAQELSRVLSSETNIEVRMAAARALGNTRQPTAIAALGDALGDSDPAMQRRAIESLKQVSGKNFGNDVGAWQQYAKGGNPQVAPPTLAERLHLRF